MATNNLISELYQAGGLTASQIQAHLDNYNNQGYNLVFVESLNGWYRFFWEKVV